MENDIFMYVAGYAGFRLAVLAGLAYALYWVSRPRPALARNTGNRISSRRNADSVFDDHC